MVRYITICKTKIIYGKPAASLFPFDRARGLRRIVVDDAVDALHLVDDARRAAAEEARVEGVDVGGHAVGRGDGAERADMVIGAAVAHHADGLDGQQHRERLPDRVIRSEEHTSELQSLMRNSYAVFCLKKKKKYTN